MSSIKPLCVASANISPLGMSENIRKIPSLKRRKEPQVGLMSNIENIRLVVFYFVHDVFTTTSSYVSKLFFQGTINNISSFFKI